MNFLALYELAAYNMYFLLTRTIGETRETVSCSLGDTKRMDIILNPRYVLFFSAEKQVRSRVQIMG